MRRVSISSKNRRPLSRQSTDRGGDSVNDDGKWMGPHDERGGDAPPMEASMVCMTVVEDGPSIAFACYDEERNEILLEAVRASDDAETADEVEVSDAE